MVDFTSSDGSIVRTEKHTTLNYLHSTTAGFAGTEFLVSHDRTIQWKHDCGGHRRPFEFRVDGCSVFQLAYASQQTLVVAVGESGCTDLYSGVHPDLIHAISTDGTFVTGEDGTLREFRLDATRIIHTHSGALRCVSRVGDFVVCGGARSQVYAFSTSGELVAEKKLSTDDDVRVMGVAGAARDSAYIVDSATNVYIWNTSTNTIQSMHHSIPTEVQPAVFLSVASGDSGELFTGSGNGFVSRLSGIPRTARIHQNGVNAIAHIPAVDYFVSVSDDQSIALWDRDLRMIDHHIDASTCSIRAVAVRGRTVVTTGTDRRLSVWELTPELRLMLIRRIPLSVTDPLAVSFVADRRVLVGGRGLQVIDIVN
jgi:WD40 repeat protein